MVTESARDYRERERERKRERILMTSRENDMERARL